MGKTRSCCCWSSDSREAAEASTDGDKVPSVLIHNATTRTIGLRDKEREVYGMLRYKIPAGQSEEISVDLREAGTYYRMAVLVMVDERNDNKVEPTHPPLFIDTEDLHTQRVIKISHRNSKYVLEKESRADFKNISKNSGGSSKRNSSAEN